MLNLPVNCAIFIFAIANSLKNCKASRYMEYAAGTYLNNIKRTSILQHLSSLNYIKNKTQGLLSPTVDPSR